MAWHMSLKLNSNIPIAALSYHSKIFVNFVNFQVFSILLILVFYRKSCFYVCFNLFEWSQVEEIARKLKEKKSDRNRSKNRVKTEQKQSSTRFRSLKRTSAKWVFCCQTIPQHFGILYGNFRSCEGEFGTRVPLRSTGASISQLRNGCKAVKPRFHN